MPSKTTLQRGSKALTKRPIMRKTKTIRTLQFFITIYNPMNPNITKLIKDDSYIIDNTEELQKIFTKKLIESGRLPND